MSRHAVPRRLAPSTLAALALVAGGATSASADQPTIGHAHGSAEHIEQEIGACLDLEFPLHHLTTFNAHFTSQVRDGIFVARTLVSSRSTYTNLATGVSLTAVSHFRDMDQHVVDNGDGTLTVRFRSAVNEAYHSPAGALVAKVVRNQTIEIVLDHGGTPEDPSDDVVVSETMSEPHGVDSLEGRSDCDIAAELLG